MITPQELRKITKAEFDKHYIEDMRTPQLWHLFKVTFEQGFLRGMRYTLDATNES